MVLEKNRKHRWAGKVSNEVVLRGIHEEILTLTTNLRRYNYGCSVDVNQVLLDWMYPRRNHRLHDIMTY